LKNNALGDNIPLSAFTNHFTETSNRSDPGFGLIWIQMSAVGSPVPSPLQNMAF